MEDKEFILRAENLNKYFGITHANKNVNFFLKKGEVRGLAGENGSGKSTLLSQIAGIYTKDSGNMYVCGKEYDPKSPRDANKMGISIVVQELGLVNSLPAGLNVYLGRTKQFSKFGIINLKRVYKSCNEILEKWGLSRIEFNKMSGEMNVENRKMVELARALSTDPQILILDEVTQSLSYDNRNNLYKLIKRFKEMGRSVILITHDLEEMIKLTDSISVLRDGELLSTEQSCDLSFNELKLKMVGRKIDGEYYREDHEETHDDEVILSVKNISTNDGLKDISFDLHRGEILGFCGLSDSGIHSVGKVVYGLSKNKNGSVSLTTENLNITKSSQALKNGIGYIPKDRDGEALMMNASIRDNFTLPSLNTIENKIGYLSNKKINNVAEIAKDTFSVKCTSIQQIISGLSGGNKQKINLGRWLIKDLNILVVDCPTRGVDIGVKAYLYKRLREAKEKGIGIILITDELQEAIGMSDNIIVMKDGEIVKKIGRSSHFTEESIVEVMI